MGRILDFVTLYVTIAIGTDLSMEFFSFIGFLNQYPEAQKWCANLVVMFSIFAAYMDDRRKQIANMAPA